MNRRVQFTVVCLSGVRVFAAHIHWPESIIRFPPICLSEFCMMMTMMAFIVNADEKPAGIFFGSLKSICNKLWDRIQTNKGVSLTG